MARDILFSETIPGLLVEEVLRQERFSMQGGHFHESIELYFLLDGARYYFVEQETFLLRPRTAILIRPGLIHQTSMSGDVPEHHRLLLQYEKDPYDRILRDLGYESFEAFAGQYGTTSVYDGIGQSDVLQIASSVSGLYFQDITISTGMADARGRDIAVQDKGTKNIYKNVKLHGYQDTWTSNNDNGLYYFEGGVLRGRTDFLCGKGDIFFNECELLMCEKGGYLAVPSKSIKYGYVFNSCTINGEKSDIDGNYTLGRPWGSGTPMAYYINTTMNVKPSAVGWNEMSGGWPKQFAEYNSVTSTGSSIDLSSRKTIFADTHTNVPTISAAEALEIGNLHNMFGDWDPTLLTEQAPLPANVTLTGNTLTWDNSDYALLWAIVKNGNVIAFTTEPTYTVDDASASYAVRAANEMGGLSEAVAAGSGTGISEVATQSADNANGKFIKNGQVVIVKDGKQYTAAGAEMK